MFNSSFQSHCKNIHSYQYFMKVPIVLHSHQHLALPKLKIFVGIKLCLAVFLIWVLGLLERLCIFYFSWSLRFPPLWSPHISFACFSSGPLVLLFLICSSPCIVTCLLCKTLLPIWGLSSYFVLWCPLLHRAFVS